MEKKHYSILKTEPDLKYKCKNVFISQASAQKDGSLKITDVSLPCDQNTGSAADGKYF